MWQRNGPPAVGPDGAPGADPGDSDMAQTQTEKSAPKSAPAPVAPAPAAELAAAAESAAAVARKGDGTLDKAALRGADRAVTFAVHASDAELGKVLLARGRKALRAEVAALLDEDEAAGN